jgi:hypothetical protein
MPPKAQQNGLFAEAAPYQRCINLRDSGWRSHFSPKLRTMTFRYGSHCLQLKLSAAGGLKMDRISIGQARASELYFAISEFESCRLSQPVPPVGYCASSLKKTPQLAGFLAIKLSLRVVKSALVGRQLPKISGRNPKSYRFRLTALEARFEVDCRMEAAVEISSRMTIVLPTMGESSVLNSKIGRLHLLVIGQFCAGAVHDHPAAFKYIGALNQR